MADLATGMQSVAVADVRAILDPRVILRETGQRLRQR